MTTSSEIKFKPPTGRELFMKENLKRPVCDCNKCKAACETKPGVLLPGDLFYIIKKEVPNPKSGEIKAYLTEHFQASEGAMVAIGGMIIRIPSIVPKLTKTGCVYYKDGSCSIHDVAPFGCSYFTVCDNQETDSETIAKAVQNILFIAFCNRLNTYSNIWDYASTWVSLKESGCIADPLFIRQSNLNKSLS